MNNLGVKVGALFVCFILVFIVYVFMSNQLELNVQQKHQYNRIDSELIPKPDEQLKRKFDEIYEKKHWGEGGGGSGSGSTIEYTMVARNIVYQVVNKYKINSILDAPCGAMAWMPLLLKNLTASNARFKYHGIDVVEKVIEKSKKKYDSKYENWKFSVFDISRGILPRNFDLIFSRDALQHLPLLNVYEALRSFATAPNARYLLVGSYLKSRQNSKINMGGYFDINLTLHPFNLASYVEQYSEVGDHQKFLVLYDIQNYLSKVDFEKMKKDVLSFK